jgi:hypothetical protein
VIGWINANTVILYPQVHKPIAFVCLESDVGLYIHGHKFKRATNLRAFHEPWQRSFFTPNGSRRWIDVEHLALGIGNEHPNWQNIENGP